MANFLWGVVTTLGISFLLVILICIGGYEE